MSELSSNDAKALIVDTVRSGEVLSGSASGRLRGHASPEPEELTLRRVQVRGTPMLQAVGRSGHLIATTNTELNDSAALAARAQEWASQPYATWALQLSDHTVQVRFTRRGRAFIGRQERSQEGVLDVAHDRHKNHLIAPDDRLFSVLGAGAGGDKRRQVDAFLHVLEASVRTAERRGLFTGDQPLTVVDLGCGNAYLTFAAHRYLTAQRPGTRTVGVEIRPELVSRSALRAQQAGLAGLEFVQGAIADAAAVVPDRRIDVVLALHACDTATDDALAQAVNWAAPVVLAAPCCHHDVQRQLKQNWEGAAGPDPYQALTRHPILRERFADVLTDTLRAGLLQQAGWTTTVSEFIDSRHTPRNAMIRAIRRQGPSEADPHVARLCEQWRITPALADRLTQPAVRAVR